MEASSRTGWRRRLAALMLTLGLVGGFGAVAVAAAPTSAPAQASVADCVNSGIAAWTTYSTRSPAVFIAGATSYWGCASTVGNWNASELCWETRQWWGAYARAKVWLISAGRFSRC